MKKNLWRLASALIISSGCFLGTVYWFNAGKNENQRGDKKPMARLNSATNEVQRKPLQRVIWESVAKNDELYPGEAVRTAPNAEAQLFFMKTGTTVHLDPDSLVVLEETDKGLSLDFLQGNMFVQSSSDSKDNEGLTLKTGNGEIKLKSADMSLSKNQNGNVNLEVHRGEAELAQAGKKTALNKEKSAELSEQGVSVASEHVQVLRPQAGETLFLNLSNGEKLDLAWTPLAAGYTVAVEVGSKASGLEKMAGMVTGGETGKLSVTAKPGHWYLRLVATANNGKTPAIHSNMIPFKVEPKSPPTLLEPRVDASVLKASPDAEVAFSWTARHKFVSQVVEIASDPQFKQVKTRETLKGDSDTFASKLDDGAYYWRVVGYLKLKDKTEGLASHPNAFKVTSKWEVKAPKLSAPVHEQHLSFFDAQKSGIPLKWQPQPGVDRYKVSVKQKTSEGTWLAILDQETETSSVRLTDLKPGIYQWTVASVDDKGGAPKASEPRQFTVENMPKVAWSDSAPSSDYQYSTPTPSLRYGWKPLSPEPAAYRYKVASEADGLETASWKTTKQNLFDISLPAEGNYLAQIEALGPKDQVLAQSDVKTFAVKRLPLLPAPQWSQGTPEVLKSDGKGNLTLGWDQVDGAQKYLMILESPTGEVVDQREVSRNTASLTRLKPGEYQVHVKSIDGLKRPGADGPKLKIEVPEKSDIRAPKIKTMKVK